MIEHQTYQQELGSWFRPNIETQCSLKEKREKEKENGGKRKQKSLNLK
jgi:hypothetical protein